MRKVICFLIPVLILISCKKSRDAISLPGTYKSGNMEKVYPPVMITKQGQVTDLGIIKNFLQFRGLQGNFIFDSSSIQVLGNVLTLTIDQNNKVSILKDSSTSMVAGEIINQTSTQIVIAGNDSVEGTVPSYYSSRCDTLNITSVIPPKTYYILPVGTYNSFSKYRPMFPVEIKNQSLVLPLLKSVVSCYNGSSKFCSDYTVEQWNIFNPSIVAQLQTGDTILYQAKDVTLLKQQAFAQHWYCQQWGLTLEQSAAVILLYCGSGLDE